MAVERAREKEIWMENVWVVWLGDKLGGNLADLLGRDLAW